MSFHLSCKRCGKANPLRNGYCLRCATRLYLLWISAYVVGLVLVLSFVFGYVYFEVSSDGKVAQETASKSSNQTSIEATTPDRTSELSKVEKPSSSLPTASTTAIPTATTPPSSTPVPLDITLADILHEYEQNKVRANARLRYKVNGKVPVTTSGYVSEVEELYVSVTPDQSSHAGLDCYYSDTRSAFHLTKGQFISVTGRVSGEGQYSSGVTMFGCKIRGIQMEENPTVEAEAVGANVVQVFCSSQLFVISVGNRGTGIILDPEEGTILTVHHVISHENNCENVEVRLAGREEKIPAIIDKHCASIDRAQLRVSPHVLSELTSQSIFWATAPAQIDQEIYFWGFGTGQLRMETGVVMKTWGDETVTDAYAIPGDSGSPVFNENGHLLGTMSRSNISDRSVFTGNRC